MKNICNDWDIGEYPYIDFAPGEYAKEENRAWQGCPSVAVTRGGRLFASWFSGGMFEPCINNYNILVMSEDGGQNWSEALLTVGSDRERLLRKIDIELWINNDNSLWVMWTVSPYTEKSLPATLRTPFECDYQREFPYTEVMICRDPDADELIWEKPRTMCKGFMRNKPIVTSSGRIIAPGYDFCKDRYMLRCSDDGGESFVDVAVEGKPDVNTFDEIAVCERREGSLRFLARTNRGYYKYSDSFDDGSTWTEAQEYEKAPSARCYYGKLKNGMIIHARNVSEAKRIGIKVCLSTDGGDTFPYEMILDERNYLSYPDIDEDENGNIYIIYDRERNNRVRLNKELWISDSAKEILLCKLTAKDIMQNKLSEGSFLSRIVSKAKKDVVEA